jgi:hypothetical protein
VSDVELEYEWVVVMDADPRDVTLYRGASEVDAYSAYNAVNVVSGWGVMIYRHLVSPLEKIREKN